MAALHSAVVFRPRSFTHCQPSQHSKATRRHRQRRPPSPACSAVQPDSDLLLRRWLPPGLLVVLHTLAAVAVLTPAAMANTREFSMEGRTRDDYFQTAPEGLSAADEKRPPRLSSLIQGPKGKQVEQCAKKCVPTCIRGGQGAPGLGPMSVRKEIIVFKEGFRSGRYCLSECLQVCKLEIDPPPAAAAAAQLAK